MDDFPVYSPDANYVKDLFLYDYVSAIFYCEDDAHESVYERLLRKIIPNIKDFAVVCLGGKSKLIKKCKEAPIEGITRIFIADKDYDDLLGKLYANSHFFYFDRACLENYLIDIGALRHICIEEEPLKLTEAKCSLETADYENYYSSLKAAYEHVTRLFIITRKYNVDNVQTTKMGMDELLAGADINFPVPTDDWCTDFRQKIQSNCRGVNEWLSDPIAFDIQFADAFSPVAGANPLTNNTEYHLNGKHLLRCVLRYIKSKLGVDLENIDCQKLYLRLINQIDFCSLNPLRDQILASFPSIAVH
jgi:hypothetical protein